MYTYIYIYIHPSIHPSIHACMHACMHTYIHTYIYIYIYICVYIYIYIYTYMYLSVYVCIHVRVCACVRVRCNPLVRTWLNNTTLQGDGKSNISSKSMMKHISEGLIEASKVNLSSILSLSHFSQIQFNALSGYKSTIEIPSMVMRSNHSSLDLRLNHRMTGSCNTTHPQISEDQPWPTKPRR